MPDTTTVKVLSELLKLSHPAPPPEIVARLEWAALKSVGQAPTIEEAAAHWHYTFKVARRVIDEAKQIHVSLEA
jgi:hypothetical protein